MPWWQVTPQENFLGIRMRTGKKQTATHNPASLNLLLSLCIQQTKRTTEPARALQK
jgi:hypothetical protein